MGYSRHRLKKNIPLSTGGIGSLTGLNNIPNFQNPTESVTPLSPQAHAQQAAQNQAQSDQLQQQLDAYKQAQGHNIMQPPETNPDQIKQYVKPTLTQNAAYQLKSIAGSLNKGIANMVIAPLYQYGNKIGLVDDTEKARILNQVADSNKETFGLDPHNLEHGDNMVHNAINQFAFMAPALITASGTGGASFGLQTAGQSSVAVQKMKDAGVKFDNHSDDLFILGSGVIGTALGRGTMGNLFNSLGTDAKNNVVSALTTDAIKELGEKGAQATAEDITRAFTSKANTLAEKVGQSGLSALQNYAKVGTEMSAANAATFGTKKLANAVSGNEPFSDVSGADFVQGVAQPFGLDKNPNGDLGTALENIATSPAGVFGAIGAGHTAIDMIGNKSPIIESLQTDPSPENVAKVKQKVSEFGQSKGWSDEEVQNAQAGVDQLANTVGKLPRSLSPSKMTKGVSLVQGQDALQSQLEQMQADRAKLHPSVANVVSPQEELIQNKIDQANDKLRQLVTGDRPTYSKGTEADGTEGEFFKTVGGVKESITPARYELESMERDVKAGKVEQPEINKEGENKDAIQEQSTGKMGLLEPPTVGEGVGEQNGSVEPAGESQPPISSSENAQPEEKVVQSVHENSPELSKIGDQKEYESHIKNIFPKSTVSRILYHGSDEPIENFKPSEKGIYFSEDPDYWPDKKHVYAAKVNIENPEYGNTSFIEKKPEGKDGIVWTKKDALEFFKDDEATATPEGKEKLKRLKNLKDTYEAVVFDPKQIHVLGSEKDIQTFKDYKDEAEIPKVSETQAGTEEPTKAEDATVSSKKESVKEQAEKAGVELDDNKGETQGKDVVESKADKALEGGYDVHELARKIHDEDHVATNVENAILAKHISAQGDEIGKLNERIQKEGATMSDHDLQELTAKREQALKDFQDVANANQQTRSAAGRALQSGQFKLNDNYSLENMILRERGLKGGKLTDKELQDVSDKHAKLEAANKDYERKLKESQDEVARLKADKKVRTPPPRTKAKTHEEFVSDRKKIAEDFSKKLADMRKGGQLNDVASASAQFLKAAAPYVAKMVTSLVHEGITELGEVVKRIREELDLKDVSLKDMHDLISGKHNEPVTKDDIQAQIRKLKTEASLLSKIHDAETGNRKLPESKQRAADEKLDVLRKRLKELDKENGLYDEKNAEASKRQILKSIAELQGKIDRKEFDKPAPKAAPDESPEARELRRKRDALRHEYEVDVAKRELEKRSKWQKAKDVVLNIASLPRAIKATLDFSAVLRQGLIPTVAHPTEAVKALGTMFGQTFSEKKYNDWFSDIKQSPAYDLMKASGLYISEKNNPELLAREEQFTSNILEKLPVIGKIHQGAERAYTGYLNAIRTGVFISEAQKLQERGYTFKNNPEVFKDLATVVNTLSGRGNIPDALGGKQPAVLSNLLFSPRFMAARIHTLYLWGDPRLSRNAKVLAAKDIGKTLATAATLLGMAKASGLSVSTDPRSSDFLKIKDGDTRYDIFGGLTQYIVFLSQQLSGQKVAAGQDKAKSLTSGKFGAPTRLDNAVSFVRGKLNPIVGSGVNLMAGKDVVGQPYKVWPNVAQEFVPLPANDLYEAYKLGGWENALKVLVPSQFGVGVNTFNTKKQKQQNKGQKHSDSILY